MTARDEKNADAPLRRDVRLLGERSGASSSSRRAPSSSNAIQIELLRSYRDPSAAEAERERVRRPLVRSIAGIAAALRNTG